MQHLSPSNRASCSIVLPPMRVRHRPSRFAVDCLLLLSSWNFATGIDRKGACRRRRSAQTASPDRKIFFKIGVRILSNCTQQSESPQWYMRAIPGTLLDFLCLYSPSIFFNVGHVPTWPSLDVSLRDAWRSTDDSSSIDLRFPNVVFWYRSSKNGG